MAGGRKMFLIFFQEGIQEDTRRGQQQIKTEKVS